MAWFRCLGGSGGGEQYTIQFGKYAKFSGSAGFILPYTINSDYKVTVVFYEDTYANDAAVIGNTGSANYSHLTEYGNKWYTSAGVGETSFGSWVGQTEHTYINNNGNSKNEFDGVEVTNYTPTTNSNISYTIGCRGGITGNRYLGYIGYYKIESLSTGDVICELRPALIQLNDVVINKGLYDTVNKVWYGEDSISNITEPYDPPISSNCRVAQGSFTSPSVIDGTITINCGFEPDFIKVLMDFGNSQTTAYYFKTDNEDNEEISVWDLRPTEGAIYQIFDPSGSVTNETGICEITTNGFKYKAHGGNTTDKACTYIAYKFDEVQPEPSVKTISFLKWQIQKTKGVPDGGYMQLSEFYLYQNDVKYSWKPNVSISSTMIGNANEGIENIIDGNIDTKFCTHDWGSTQTNRCDIVISLGEAITIDSNTSYSYVTANDGSSRDPIAWILYGSSDGTNWEKLDSVTDTVITDARKTETSKYDIIVQYSLDEDAFYQNGAWLHPEDMTMFVTGGSIDSDGNITFDSTTDICGVSTDTLTDYGKYKYVFFARNTSSTTLTVQYGASTPGYTTQQIIGSGQGRQSYVGGSVAPNDRFVGIYDVNHAGGNSGIFFGMYPTNNIWKIEKILRIPIT